MSLASEQNLESAYVMGTFARKPVELVRGSGMAVFDDEGPRIPRLHRRHRRGQPGPLPPGRRPRRCPLQAEKLVHVSNYYYVEHRGEVARLLSGLLNQTVAGGRQGPLARRSSRTRAPRPTNAPSSWRASTPASAPPPASRRKPPGRTPSHAAEEAAPRLVVTLEGSFHGRTLATLAATAQPAKQEAFQPLPDGFVAAPPNDVVALEALFEAQGDQVLRRDGGVRARRKRRASVHVGISAGRPPAYRPSAARCSCATRCRCGIYRCGTYPFGFQHFGILPDVVTIAKGVASGMPTGHVRGTRPGGRRLRAGRPWLHVRRQLPGGGRGRSHAAHAGRRGLRRARGATRARICANAWPRCQGWWKCEGSASWWRPIWRRKTPAAPDVVARGLDAGVLLNATGPHTLRFLPPLVCARRHVDALVEKLVGLL